MAVRAVPFHCQYGYFLRSAHPVRGRIGYVWGTNGDVLTYVTGGLAYGEVKINVTGGQVATHTRFTDGILRAGLNYQFH